MSDVSALRCSICGLNYPADKDYEECLRCGEDTWPMTYGKPMSRGDLEELRREVASVQRAASGTNEQWLITYRDRQGQNPNGEYLSEVFFATAYDVEECHRQMHLCRRLHNLPIDHVRAIVATGRPPKDGGPVAVNA